MQQHGQQSRFC